jgi:transposase
MYVTTIGIDLAKHKGGKLSRGTQALIEHRGYKRAAVALAARNARILWAMMVNNETYRPKAA